MDILKLNVLIAFSLLITIGEVCMFKSDGNEEQEGYKYISRCEQCDRVRTSFSSKQLTISPLLIRSMFYRWSCDLVKEITIDLKR